VSERVVIVIEYEAPAYNEQWFIDVVRPLREHLDQGPIKPVGVTLAIEDHADQVLAVFAKDSHS